jgi:MFS family permease
MSDRFKTDAARRCHAGGVKSREDQLPAAGSRTRPGVILALTCAAQFMVVLDPVVVNVALPTMQNDAERPPSQFIGSAGVVISYGLTFGGFLLLGGRAADLLGRRNVLVIGLTMSTVGRRGPGAQQGTRDFRGCGRQRCLGLVVSGILVDGPGWRWIFLVNVPIGIALAASVLTCVPGRTRPPRISQCARRGHGHGRRTGDRLRRQQERRLRPDVARPGRAVRRVKDKVSGLAGGMVSTAQEVGAALGLAVIAPATLAQDRSRTPTAARQPSALSPRPRACGVARWWMDWRREWQSPSP